MLCDGGILVVYDEDANTDSQEGIKWQPPRIFILNN